MNFLNPLITIYFRHEKLQEKLAIPFHKEILWLFSKNLNNGLKLFQSRVNIIFVDSKTDVGIKKIASIYEYHLFENIEIFKELDEDGQKRRLLELIFQAFMELASKFNWNKSVIKTAFEKSLEEHCRFVYYTDYKLNQNKKDKARIAITLDKNIVTFYSEIYDAELQDLSSTELLSTGQENFSWKGKIRDYGWLNKSKFGLKLMKGELWIVTDKNNSTIEEIINPKKYKIGDIADFLAELREKPAYNNI